MWIKRKLFAAMLERGEKGDEYEYEYKKLLDKVKQTRLVVTTKAGRIVDSNVENLLYILDMDMSINKEFTIIQFTTETQLKVVLKREERRQRV